MATFWNKKGEGRDSEFQGGNEVAVDSEAPAGSGRMDPVSAGLAAAGRDPVGADAEAEIGKRFGSVRMVLSAGTVIEGKLNFDSPVRIDGKLTGEIFSAKTLIVAPGGEVDATIETGSLIVMGRVKGSVVAAQSVEIHPGGRVEGEIHAPSLAIKDGAVFNGKCSMAETGG